MTVVFICLTVYLELSSDLYVRNYNFTTDTKGTTTIYGYQV